jgi:hypothetical protein
MMRLVDAVRRDALQRFVSMFIVSFSKLDDSLSQWRAYANNGDGLALGFDLRELWKEEQRVADGLSQPLVNACIYDENTQRQTVAEMLRPLLTYMLKNWKDLEDRNAAQVALIQQVLVAANLLGVMMKNPGFHEEAEWRVVVMKASEAALSSVRFRDTKYGPAPYVELPLSKTDKLPLTNVVFGPRVEAPAKRSIRMMLESYGYSPTITNAKATYRA